MPHTPHPQAQDPAAQPSLYDDPIIYDILHAPGTALEVNGLERLTAQQLRTTATHAPKRQTWLEPACGTARHLRLAAQRGYHTLGFDRCPAMIDDANARAQRRGLAQRCTLFVADMTDFRVTPRSIDLAFNLINTIRHLPSDQQLHAHLALIADALKPGGLYAVGLSTTAYGLEPPSEDVWTAARGPCRVTQAVQYEPPTNHASRTERVTSHLTIERPSGEQHRTSAYALRTYSLEQWLDALERSPMTTLGTCDESGRPRPPAETGYRLWLLTPRR